jgi:hypothetical protein
LQKRFFATDLHRFPLIFHRNPWLNTQGKSTSRLMQEFYCLCSCLRVSVVRFSPFCSRLFYDFLNVWEIPLQAALWRSGLLL